jgi:putative transposase
VKTLEFKLNLNQQQQANIDRWLSVQQWVWNQGLGLLKEFENFSRYNKHDKAHAPCCPVNWEYRYIPNPDADGYVSVPFSRIGSKPKYGEYRQYCPIPQPYRQPRLDRDSEYSLRKLFAYKLHLDKPWLAECPYKIMQGTVQQLATAWEEYRKGKRKSPRFKGRDNPIKTISNPQAGVATVQGDRVKLPKLGKIKIRSAARRWHKDLEVKTFRITKEPSGYYLLLVGNIETPVPKLTDKACGVDPGVASAVTLDNGRQFAPTNPLKKQLKRLRRLQRKASRQVKGSNGQKRTHKGIARLHEKVRRSRKAFNHKVSTKLVREYGAIAFEDTNLKNMTRAPKPKLREDGKGYERNGAAAKAGLNRSLLDVAIGQLRTLTEEKCKAWGREFTRPQAQNSSITCNACGAVDKANRKSQSSFICVACGHADHADGNAAKNHLLRGLTKLVRVYRPWGWEVKRVESPTDSLKPEESQDSPMPENGIQSSNPEKNLGKPKARKRRNACNSVEKNSQKSTFAKTEPAILTQLELQLYGVAEAEDSEN